MYNALFSLLILLMICLGCIEISSKYVIHNRFQAFARIFDVIVPLARLADGSVCVQSFSSFGSFGAATLGLRCFCGRVEIKLFLVESRDQMSHSSICD